MQMKFWNNIGNQVNKLIKEAPSKMHIGKPFEPRLTSWNRENIPDSLRRKIWNAVSSVRDVQIARIFLKKVTDMSCPHPSVLFLGPSEIGKTRYLKT